MVIRFFRGWMSRKSTAEIAQGREELQAITGGRVELFAYPNGQPKRDYLWRDVEILKRQGFEGAVSTAWGVVTAKADALQMPRIGFSAARGEVFHQKLIRARLGSAGLRLGPGGPAGRLI